SRTPAQPCTVSQPTLTIRTPMPMDTSGWRMHSTSARDTPLMKMLAPMRSRAKPSMISCISGSRCRPRAMIVSLWLEVEIIFRFLRFGQAAHLLHYVMQQGMVGLGTDPCGCVRVIAADVFHDHGGHSYLLEVAALVHGELD